VCAVRSTGNSVGEIITERHSTHKPVNTLYSALYIVTAVRLHGSECIGENASN